MHKKKKKLEFIEKIKTVYCIVTLYRDVEEDDTGSCSSTKKQGTRS